MDVNNSLDSLLGLHNGNLLWASTPNYPTRWFLPMQLEGDITLPSTLEFDCTCVGHDRCDPKGVNYLGYGAETQMGINRSLLPHN